MRDLAVATAIVAAALWFGLPGGSGEKLPSILVGAATSLVLAAGSFLVIRRYALRSPTQEMGAVVGASGVRFLVMTGVLLAMILWWEYPKLQAVASLGAFYLVTLAVETWALSRRPKTDEG